MTAKQYNTTSVFVAACAGMAFFGVTMLSLAPILGKLNALVGEGALSLPSTMSIGIILGTVIFGPVVDRFGYKWLLIISSVLALAGVQGLAHFTQLPVLHGSMFCLGLGGGILNGLTNALVSDIYDDDKRGGRLGVLGAFYCIGALLWTLLNYFIPDYSLPLNAISVVMALFIVFFCVTAFPQAKPSGSVSLNKSLGLLKGAYIAMALIGFGVGATFPVVLNYIGGAFRDQSGTAMSIAIFIALLGQFTFNRLTGNAFALGRYATLPALMFTAVVAMMIIVPFALRFVRKGKTK